MKRKKIMKRIECSIQDARQSRSSTLLMSLLALCALALLGAVQPAHAQWSQPDASGNTTYNTGNVGIGTSTFTPTNPLTIARSGSSPYTSRPAYELLQLVDRTDNTPEILFGSAYNGMWLRYTGTDGTASHQRLGIVTGGAGESFVINNDGLVGIGTTNPSYRLHIAGDNTSTGGYPIFKLQNTQTNGHSWWLYSGAMGVAGAFGLYDETAASYRMFFDSSGNTGFGTTTPQARLHVYGGRIMVQPASSGSFMMINDPTWGNTGDFETTANGDLHLKAYSDAFATPQLFLKNGGNVGIGTTGPLQKLDVAGNLGLGPSGNTYDVLNIVPGTAAVGQVTAIKVFNSNSLQLTTFNPGTAAYNNGILIDTSGNVGVGLTSPGYKLDVGGGQINAAGGFCIAGDCKTSWSQLGSQWTTSGSNITYSSGNVGIGTTSAPTHTLEVNGSANVSGAITGGTINATFQDVAEWVPSSQHLVAGTVVVLDDNQTNHVLASVKAYDTRVAGVISAQPGISLGQGGEGKVLVATTGRVKVKADATRSPIHVGDLLVTSEKEGVAMKSEPIDLGGTAIHRPGTIIGKALEPLNSGVAEILVLLSLQ
jgi:hypothetical protein